EFRNAGIRVIHLGTAEAQPPQRFHRAVPTGGRPHHQRLPRGAGHGKADARYARHSGPSWRRCGAGPRSETDNLASIVTRSDRYAIYRLESNWRKGKEEAGRPL